MITANQLDEQLSNEARAWELPYVGDGRSAEASKTNALNRKSDWKYEPPVEEEEILPPTAEEIEEIRRLAYDEGFAEGKREGQEKGHQEGLLQGQQQGHQEGLTAGREEGITAGQSEIAEEVAIWQQLMNTLHNPVANVERDLQRELVALAVGLARAVVNHEVKTNGDVIFQALTDGLQVLPIQEKQYKIRMHPEDISLVTAQFSQEDIEKHRWLLVEAPELERGGCDISTENNAVDVTLERRCREILDKFLHEQGLSRELALE